jgi:2-oxoglutarate/2-oxoacid ferredoxin oxidoreductase subunit alpha
MSARETMRFELIMDAGNGAQKAGDILIKTFAKSGRFVFIEPLIPAEISPPKRTPHSLSGAVIRVSNNELSNIGSTTELMLIEHEILLKRRLQDKEYGQGATVLVDMGDSSRFSDDYQAEFTNAKNVGLNVIGFSMTESVEATIKELRGNGKNMFYMGILSVVFQLDSDLLMQEIRSTFKKLKPEILDKNISIYEEGRQIAEELDLEKRVVSASDQSSEDNILLDGNTALSLGIIDSGIKLYSGYPITPASSIMHNLAKLFPSYGGKLHQAEDEIAAIGVAIGSYFSGVPAITATSGPGLSLKQEFIGLAQVTEVPLIVVNVQRGGPSTGLPTRTEQTDLYAAAFGSHGDSTKIVLSVANVEDCFYAPHIARYLTEKLRVPVIIMSDYLISVSYRVLDQLELVKMENVDDIPDFVLERFGLNRITEKVEMVKENLADPGTVEKMRRITGLNTDDKGQVEYSSESNHRSHQIRNEKVHVVRRALKEPEIFGEKSGDVLVIAWGSGRGVLEESIDELRSEGLDVSGLHLKMVYPLPLMLTDIFKNFKKVITIEMAYGDELKPTPLATLLRSETLIDIKCGISDATGRPLKPTQVVSKIKELVKG